MWLTVIKKEDLMITKIAVSTFSNIVVEHDYTVRTKKFL